MCRAYNPGQGYSGLPLGTWDESEGYALSLPMILTAWYWIALDTLLTMGAILLGTAAWYVLKRIIED